jgi:hypothetical protein
MMTRETHMTDEVNADRTDLKRTFSEIREALEKAQSREDLTELYKQSVYMILMTHSTPLDEKDKEMKIRRETTEKEFASTVRMINQQAKKIGTEADYNENWEKLATNSYRTEEIEGENVLEAENTSEITKE